MVAYISEPGSSGNNVTTPHKASLDFGSSLSVLYVGYVALNDWTPGTETALFSIYGATAANGMCRASITTTGTMKFYVSVGGASFSGVTTTVLQTASGVLDGAGLWVWFMWQSSDGTVDFKYSLDPPTEAVSLVTWTTVQLNRASSTSGILTTSTEPVRIGGFDTNGGTNPLAGKVYRSLFYSGSSAGITTIAGGTLLLDMDPSQWTTGTTFVSGGDTWTINGTATIVVLPDYVPPILRPQMARRGFALRRRQSSTSVTVTFLYAPPPSRPRIIRRAGIPRRRQQPTVPLTQTTAVTVTFIPGPVRPQRRLASTRRRRPIVVTVTQIAVPAVPPIARPIRMIRRALWARDRQQPVTPIVTVVVVPTIARPMRMVRRALWSRSRIQPVTPPTQTAAVVVPFLPGIAPARHRLGFGRRAHLVTVTITQTAAQAPTFVPVIARPRRRGLWARDRQQPVIPVVTVTVVPGIGRPQRRPVWPRHRGQPTAPLVTVTITPTIARARRRFGWLRRRGQPATLSQGAVVVTTPDQPGPVLYAHDPGVIRGSDPGVSYAHNPGVIRGADPAPIYGRDTR